MSDFAPLAAPRHRLRPRRVLSSLRSLLAAGFLTAGAGSTVAAAYPATGNQLFTYADGLVAGSGAWNDGSTLSSTTMGDPPVPVAAIQSSALRLTADGVLNSVSSFKIPEIDPGLDVSALTISFTLKLKHAGTPGGGFTVGFGEIPEGDGDGELGFALPKGLEIAWETDVDPAPGGSQGQIVVYANRVKLVSYPQTFASDDTYRNVSIQWGTTGLSISWNGVSIGSAIPVPGFQPTVGDRAAFTARTTSGGSQEISIDSLRVSTTPAATIVTGGPVITEFVAENGGSYEDEDLDRSDWLEIFNGSNTAVAMGGWHLTDDPLV
ncbi:MAG: Spore coat protein CotH, partial [Verrucomicrobiales bacterium]|nr:Spore coat protein CotH [Verrucomicrobiales bacterium]